MSTRSEIYLDYAATTLLKPQVGGAIASLLASQSNPSAAHRIGREAAQLLREFRRRCATCLGAIENELIFTSCGTESNNLATQGSLRHLKRTGSMGFNRRHSTIACSAIEHSSIRKTFENLKPDGQQTVEVSVTEQGIVEPEQLGKYIDRETVLVSIVLGNNEVGTIQPIPELAHWVKGINSTCVLHTDAVQCVGKIPVQPNELGVDMLSLSAHKFGGPKGIGLLWVRRGLFIDPVYGGGKQERGLRPGTENLPAIAGVTVALEEAVKDQEGTHAKLSTLRDALEEEILGMNVGAWVNCKDAPRLPHISSVTFPGVNAESLLLALDREGIYVSTGSACSIGNPDPSPTLLAIGLTPEEAKSTIRFSFGEGNDLKQVKYVAMKLKEILRKNFKVGN